MSGKKSLIASCLIVSSTFLLTPQVSLAKETTLSNFFTKIFTSKSTTQSNKTKIFKTDIETLNIQNLDDFEFSIQDILRNYFDKKTVSQFLNNISNEDDNNLDANSLDQFDNLLPKTKTDKINVEEINKIKEQSNKVISKHPAAYPEIMITSSLKNNGIGLLRTYLASFA